MRVALVAGEMCSYGGIQSFMWRVVEVINELVMEGVAEGKVFSLNDTTNNLKTHPNMPKTLLARGADHSKCRLIKDILRYAYPIDILIVGHIGPAPLAYLLHKFGCIKRYFVILHGIEAWKRVSILERYAARSAERVIATTQYTVNVFSRRNKIDESLLQVIPICTDEASILPQQRIQLKGGFKLLCVARLAASERYKGVDHIFQALAKFKSRYPEIHLNVVGDGDDRTRLQFNAEELGVADQVTFWGHLSDEELNAAYTDCDVFVMPSKMEGFGIVFLEAMRHGKPCIGGNSGGTPEVIEHRRSGFLVEYGDVDALARHIESFYNDSSLAGSLGARGYEIISSKFNSTRFRKSYRNLIMGYSI